MRRARGLLLGGTVETLRGDSIVVRLAGDRSPLLVPTASLAQLDVHRDDPARGRVMRTLGVVGALAGGGVYVKWCLDHREACVRDAVDDPDDPRDDSASFSIATLMIGGGAIAGVLLGQAVTPGRWEPVRRPLRLGVVPWAGGGFAVVAGFSF